jgi:hypothetical protein
MLYRIDSFYADKITMTPTIPVNGLTENGREDNKTPRLCFSDSLIGCLAAQGTLRFNYSYVVYVPVNQKIKVHKPTKKQCPDAHITGEVWYTGKPIELVPIGKLYTADNLFKVGEYPSTGKKKKMIPVYACEYAFVPLKKSKNK